MVRKRDRADISFDEFDGRDPQIRTKHFMPLNEELVGQVDADADADADHPIALDDVISTDPRDQLLTLLRSVWDPNSPLFVKFSRQEREIITQRSLLSNDQATYRAIARTTTPPLRPEQVRRIEQRATRKLAHYFSNVSKDLEEKV
jgi:hypothetical protein